MNIELLGLYLQSMPLALGSAYLSFFGLGIYRGVWRYVGFDDLLRYFQAALGSIVLLAAALFIVGSLGLLEESPSFAPEIPVLFGIYLFLGLAATRSSFRLLDLFSARRIQARQVRVLILGAGDAGEMALRWVLMRPELNYRPVGLLDEDPFMHGRQIHGVKVLGGLERLDELLEEHKVAGVILAGVDPGAPAGQQLRSICRKSNCWVRNLRLEFELVE
jgi:FlaA1/EpsC-like NDP-sugar epimerase